MTLPVVTGVEVIVGAVGGVKVTRTATQSREKSREVSLATSITLTRKLVFVKSLTLQVRPQLSAVPEGEGRGRGSQGRGVLRRGPAGPSIPRELHTDLRSAGGAVDLRIEPNLHSIHCRSGGNAEPIVVEAMLVFAGIGTGGAGIRPAIGIDGKETVECGGVPGLV